jgi:nucleoside-diphosphate-sugar epimerase
MAETYLVTGGAGFIGSNIVAALVAKGRQVRVLDNFSSGRKENLASVRDDIELIEGDIRDLMTVQRSLPGVKYVLHQAAVPSVPRSIEDPLESNASNITGTLNVLLASKDSRVRRFIFASSSSVYGDTPVLPKTEHMPPSLLSPYALNKLTGEYYCKLFSSIYGLETVSLRYFNVFGPRQNPESEYAAVIPKFITAFLLKRPAVIYGDGEQTRDFTYIDNVVEANLLALEAPQVAGQIVNIASGERISLNQLVAHLEALTGENLPPTYTAPRVGDVRHSLADITLASELLGYHPLVDWKTGLQRTLAWFSRS